MMSIIPAYKVPLGFSARSIFCHAWQSFFETLLFSDAWIGGFQPWLHSNRIARGTLKTTKAASVQMTYDIIFQSHGRNLTS